jgi:hypothetical protein
MPQNSAAKTFKNGSKCPRTWSYYGNVKLIWPQQFVVEAGPDQELEISEFLLKILSMQQK